MKKITRRSFLTVCGAAAAAAALTACGGSASSSASTAAGSAASSTAAALSGNVAAGGSTSMKNVIAALTEGFAEVEPGVTVSYDPTGSGAGITGATDKTLDIGLSSRALKDDEKADVDGTTIALDGIAIIVNNASKVEDLTVDQLKQMFTGEITNWSEVGGDDATDDPTPGKTPVLTIKDNALGVINVEAAGQTVTLNYEVADAVEGKLAVAKSDKEWIHDFDCETFGQITFVADENVGEELTRSATVTISYPGAESVAVEVAQNERAISIEVTEVTVASIKAKLETDDPAQTFLFNLVKKSDYDAIGSPEKFLEKELKALEEEALDSDGWFTSLEEYLDFLLSDWNPEGQNLNRDELEINTEYYIYAYGIDVKGEITTPLVRRLVKTNDFKEINFNLTVEDEGQTTATLKGNPDEKFTYYYLGYTSKTEYEDSFKGDDQQVIDNALGSIRMGIGNDGSKLPDVASVRMGEGSLEVEGLLPDTEYYALAFGIDNSVSACTKLTKTPFKTDAVAITDDCKFEVSVLDVNSILMNIAVKPSKATTRYFATVKATDEVKNTFLFFGKFLRLRY